MCNATFIPIWVTFSSIIVYGIHIKTRTILGRKRVYLQNPVQFPKEYYIWNWEQQDLEVDQEIDGKMKWERMEEQLAEKGCKKKYLTERNGRSSWEWQGIVTFCSCQCNEWMNEWMNEMSFCQIYIKKNKFLSLLGRHRSARSKNNIYSLFNDSVRSSDYAALNGIMISKRCIG